MPIPNLVDAEERNRQFPGSYEIPSENDRKNISPNSTVKLGFKTENNPLIEAEFLKVTVEDSEAGQDIYYGVLEESGDFVLVKRGDKIQFGANHVFEIR